MTKLSNPVAAEAALFLLRARGEFLERRGYLRLGEKPDKEMDYVPSGYVPEEEDDEEEDQ